MDVFEDINRILGDLEYGTYLLGEKARNELHHVMQEKANLYKDSQKGSREEEGLNLKDVEPKRISQQLDTQLALTLRFMDETPIIKRVSKMSLEEIEALSESERRKLRTDVLEAIENAKRKARVES